MEITGKVIKILDVQEFTSKKPEKQGVVYKRYTFVLETEGNYPKRTVFSVLGEDKFKQMNIAVGGKYCVSFDIDAREYNGKWYNEVSAWKAVAIDGQGAQQTVSAKPLSPSPFQTPAAPAQSQGEDADQLPF